MIALLTGLLEAILKAIVAVLNLEDCPRRECQRNLPPTGWPQKEFLRTPLLLLPHRNRPTIIGNRPAASSQTFCDDPSAVVWSASPMN